MYYVVLVLGLAGTEQRGEDRMKETHGTEDRTERQEGEVKVGCTHCSTLLLSNTCLLSVLIFTVGTFTLAVNWFPAMT